MTVAERIQGERAIRVLSGKTSVETWDVKSYANAAIDGFWIRWTAETRLPEGSVLALVTKFFDGLDVTIEQFAPGAGYRQGYNVVLNSLPLRKFLEAGQEPSEVKWSKQEVLVQSNDTGFHAFGMGSYTATALAVGLLVYVRETWKEGRE